MTLLYNCVMLAVDAAAIRLVSRRTRLTVWWFVMFCAAVIALATGVILAERHQPPFGIVRLWTYGLLLHGSVLLAATTFLWRRHRPWLAAVTGTGTLAVALIAVDAFLIEPTWLEVSHRRFSSPKIHHPLRLVVIADLQTDQIGPYERRVLSQTLEQKPDIILFAGDYIQAAPKQYESLCRELNNLLRELHFSAPLGVFAVQGNVDPLNWRAAFANLGITAVSSSRSMELEDLRLTCLGMHDSFNYTLEVAAGDPQKYHIVLGHGPAFALGKVEADLLIAGHTHGGQIQLPILGPLVTNCPISRDWAAGLNDLPNGRKLLVSRGVGMERGLAPRLRFYCRPELLVIDLVPQNSSSQDIPSQTNRSQDNTSHDR